jgi:hypothetical protein
MLQRKEIMGCDVTEAFTGTVIEHSVQALGPEYIKWNNEVTRFTDWIAVGV